ncbi:uncharacterized protein LOC132283416 [Cornus florida]|uniref:uncharacterized protein LOC132283416 n=1 Tax=Cornus florida TaxID=4283 RepID=UPI00289804DE|nr:uncharacterized protein LOC132283416 [Cornus florida]
MASAPNTSSPSLNYHHPTSIHRFPNHHKITLRRRRLPMVRLGGKKRRRGFFLVRLFRRVRVRWLKLKYSCMLKKLKEYYHSVVKDIMEAGGTIEAFHQRILLETSFAVPVLGISFSNFPNSYA